MGTPALKREEGFGLVELLMAMVILNVALLAIVASFSSAGAGVTAAARVGTAGAIADRQMEQYRAMTYGWIGLYNSGTTDATYLADPACATHTGGTPPCGEFVISSGPCFVSFTGALDPCTVIHNLLGPDKHAYRVDTYITRTAAAGNKRATKTVTVVVRDTKPNLPVLARQTSTFDCSTGGGSQFNSGNTDC